MKSSLMLICLTLLFPWFSFSQPASINITTFNLRWFGIGGDPNAPKPEFRIPIVKKMIETYLQNTGIFVFEEIVKIEALAQILPPGWQCISYVHPGPTHQHVALCATPAIALNKVSYDDNFTIEEATGGNPNLRPAMRVDVTEKATKRSLFTIVGVHLKAMPDQTALRVAQVQAISKDLAKIPANRPVVIVGDMNSFTMTETKLPQDDIEYILKGLNSVSTGYFHVPYQSNIFTFRSPQFRNQFDQYFVRGTMRVTALPNVFPVCSATQNGSGYLNFDFYYKNVSDHCPSTMQIIVN